jgi:hypothetical protein
MRCFKSPTAIARCCSSSRGHSSAARRLRALGIPAGTARSRPHRARRKTRAALGDTGFTDIRVLGRPAYALGETDDWLHEEILVDREPYAYGGTRSTVVRDATIDPAKAGNPTGQVHKVSIVVSAREVTAVVDKAGQRP